MTPSPAAKETKDDEDLVDGKKLEARPKEDEKKDSDAPMKDLIEDLGKMVGEINQSITNFAGKVAGGGYDAIIDKSIEQPGSTSSSKSGPSPMGEMASSSPNPAEIASGISNMAGSLEGGSPSTPAAEGDKSTSGPDIAEAANLVSKL